VLEYALNVAGSEWIIIIFVALVLILGTNKLPEAAKKLGKAMNEYNKAKNDMQNQMKDFSSQNLEINGPVKTERQKLQTMVKSLGIDPVGKSNDDLREIISSKIGQPEKKEPENSKS